MGNRQLRLGNEGGSGEQEVGSGECREKEASVEWEIWTRKDGGSE